MSRPDGNTKDGSIPLGIEIGSYCAMPKWSPCRKRKYGCRGCYVDRPIYAIKKKGFTQKMLDDFF